jgi:hypothetical protein
MSALKDGKSGEHESETKDKGSKQQRYILFIGMSLPSPPPSLSPLSELRRREPQVHHDAQGNPGPFLPVRCVLTPPYGYCATLNSLTIHTSLTNDTRLPAHDRPASDCAPTHSQAHPSWCDGDQVQRLRVPRVLDTVSAAGCPAYAPV